MTKTARTMSTLILTLCIGGIVAICAGWNSDPMETYCPTASSCVDPALVEKCAQELYTDDHTTTTPLDAWRETCREGIARDDGWDVDGW
jgi:hypothetical protein